MGIKRTTTGLTLAVMLVSSLCSTTSVAASEAAGLPASLSDAFSTDRIDVHGIAVLNEIEMDAIQGAAFPLMPFVFGVAGLDLALIGVYWGTYVPHYLSRMRSGLVHWD